MKDLEIEFPVTPITEKTFIRQGWEKCTEEEVDEYNIELERIRLEREKNDTEGEWGKYDPFMYPHKESEKLKELLVHPKIHLYAKGGKNVLKKK